MNRNFGGQYKFIGQKMVILTKQQILIKKLNFHLKMKRR